MEEGEGRTSWAPHKPKWKSMQSTIDSSPSRNLTGATAPANTIVTHDGFFHSDEALAVWMIRRLPQFQNHVVVRSRDMKVIEAADCAIDVGLIYDPSRLRFDHHQQGFNTYFSDVEKKMKIPLSSAGLIYKHYGMQVISTSKSVRAEDEQRIYQQLYETFIRPLDAHDNGVPQFSDGAIPLYVHPTTLPARVSHLNAQTDLKDQMAAFEQAVALTGSEFTACLDRIRNIWLPRQLKFDPVYKQVITYDYESQEFSNGFRPTPKLSARSNEISKGKVLLGSESESYINELHNAEKELIHKLKEMQTKNTVTLRCYFDKVNGSFMNALEVMSASKACVDHKQCTMVLTEVRIPAQNSEIKQELSAILESLVYFVVFPVTKPVDEKKRSTQWMVRTIPVTEGSFEYRLGLPDGWRGLEQTELRRLSQIPDINFVHRTGFIGGCETQEGALRLVHSAFVSCTLHPLLRPQ
jgi:uncharacterized UPF0160 family protein